VHLEERHRPHDPFVTPLATDKNIRNLHSHFTDKPPHAIFEVAPGVIYGNQGLIEIGRIEIIFSDEFNDLFHQMLPPRPGTRSHVGKGACCSARERPRPTQFITLTVSELMPLHPAEFRQGIIQTQSIQVGHNPVASLLRNTDHFSEPLRSSQRFSRCVFRVPGIPRPAPAGQEQNCVFRCPQFFEIFY